VSAAKRKGSGFELEVVHRHQALGIDAFRIPLSGAVERFPGDIQIAGMIAECKRRKKSYTSLYSALEQGGGSDMMFCRDDQRETLVVLPWQTWELIIKWLDWPTKFPAAGGTSQSRSEEDDA
jgi:hypothetical protein